MAATMDSKLSKNVTKSIGRAKEKILQNLGKVDRTADEIFDEHVTNFNKQQNAATRIQKELSNYIKCIRACATANLSLMEAVSEIYEPEWGGKEELNNEAAQSELLWNDFAHRLAEQVLIPLNTYQAQFPEMRKKIEKRGRKLVDFDGERHSLQALQSNPRRAEAKLNKQRESLEAAKRTYEVLNSELHEELPGLYNSRIVFLVSAMSTLFAAENIFHSDSNKVYNHLEGIVERLGRETAKGTLNFKSSNHAILNNTPESIKEDLSPQSSAPLPHEIESKSDESPNMEIPSHPPTLQSTPSVVDHNTNNIQQSTNTNSITQNIPSSPTGSENHHHKNGKSTPGAEDSKKEPGVLYRVRATYRYQKEDVDELSFDAGEIIRVVEYDDPEEQEEGWLMGIKDNGEKGMFPANFTRPI